MRSDEQRLRDMIRAISSAKKYLEFGETRFLHDELLQVWALHHLQITGEVARGLSVGIRSNHPEVPWPQIIGFRNPVGYEYFGIHGWVAPGMPEPDAGNPFGINAALTA